MSEKKIYKAIPKSEDGPGVVCNGKDVYIVSQNLDKKQFTLWRKVPEGYEKIATANNPDKLYDKVVWF